MSRPSPTSTTPASGAGRAKTQAAPVAKVPRTAGGSKKKGSGGNRKGSVDKSGKDVDSPRAKAIVENLRGQNIGVITDDAALEGKRVLARVLWALDAADKAGSELGLTAADASANAMFEASSESSRQRIG